MKRLMLGTVASLVLAAIGFAGASAQGTVTTNWSGLYLGVNGTFQSNNTTYTIAHDGYGDGVIAPSVNGGTFSQHANGNGLGAQLGFNAQHGRFVYGVDVDYDQNNLVVDSLNNLGTNGGGYNVDYQTVLKSTTTGTVRVGIANNSTLYYLKGGAALGRFVSNINTGNAFAFNQTHLTGGYTWGAGADWAFDAKNPNVTAGIEYDYTKFNNVAFGGELTPDNTFPVAYTLNNANLSEVQVRISYKLP